MLQTQQGGERPIFVQLASERQGLGDNNNYEPEFIKVRAPNNYTLILNSDDIADYPNKTDLVFSTQNNVSIAPQPLILRTKRFAIAGLSFLADLWNVTPRNNNIDFTFNGSSYTCTLAVGQYTTALSMITEILNKMNTASGGDLTATATVAPGLPLTYTVTSTSGKLWAISPTCSAVIKGGSMYNLPVAPSPRNPQTVGPIFLEYPRIIYFASQQLSQYAKRQSITTQNIPNLVHSVFDYVAGSSYQRNVDYNNLCWYNFDSTAAIYRIDMTLYDEFGEQLYIPQDTNTYITLRANPIYSLRLLCEM